MMRRILDTLEEQVLNVSARRRPLNHSNPRGLTPTLMIWEFTWSTRGILVILASREDGSGKVELSPSRE